ncbi:MAG: hypothetical protein AABX66_01400 [Nanoarchaeota archaeon]
MVEKSELNIRKKVLRAERLLERQLQSIETTERFRVEETRPFGDLAVLLMKSFHSVPSYMNVTFLAYNIPKLSDLYVANVPNFDAIVKECKKRRVMPGVSTEMRYHGGSGTFYLISANHEGGIGAFNPPYCRENLQQILGGGKFHGINVILGDDPDSYRGISKFIKGGLLDRLLKLKYHPIRGELWFEASPALVQDASKVKRVVFSTRGHGAQSNKLEIELFDSGLDDIVSKLNWFDSIVTTYLKKCTDTSHLSNDPLLRY